MKGGSQSQLRKAEVFSRFDVKETSFHVYTGRIDLHLCDDALPGKSYLPFLTLLWVQHWVTATSPKNGDVFLEAS